MTPFGQWLSLLGDVIIFHVALLQESALIRPQQFMP
jgi:hypothetical protein